MSDTVVIAFLSFFGAVLGAVITAAGTIISGLLKKSQNSNPGCVLVLIGGIGGVVGLVMGAMLGLAVNKATSISEPPALVAPSPSVSNVAPSSAPAAGSFLSSCAGLQSGETRLVTVGDFILGDIFIDGVKQLDDGVGEGTVAYFERTAKVEAPWGAGCYHGTADRLEFLVQRELRFGCGSSGCTTVRAVIVKRDGNQEVKFYTK